MSRWSIEGGALQGLPLAEGEWAEIPGTDFSGLPHWRGFVTFPRAGFLRLLGDLCSGRLNGGEEVAGTR